MEKDIVFLSYNSSVITQVPFCNKFSHAYSVGSKGIVFHSTDIEIIEDELSHIYLNEVPSNLGRAIEKYVIDEKEELECPKTIFVVYGNDYYENESLSNYLEENLYRLFEMKDDYAEDYVLTKDENNPYRVFIRNVKNFSSNNNFEVYLLEMFKNIQLFNPKFNAELAFKHCQPYISNFHVALTSPTFEQKPLGNYELFEIVGDQVAWRVMNEIFLDYMEKNKIPMKESVITSLHRSFASKTVQAKICKDIGLHSYIKTATKEITVDVREDIFEAMTGAFYYVNFLIICFIGVDHKLHENFLKWCYQGMDFSEFEEKPEITKFYEYMKSIVGPFKFKERKIHGGYRMTHKIEVSEEIKNFLTPYFVESNKMNVDQLDRFISELLKMVRNGYGFGTEDIISERRKNYSKINRFIEDNLTEQFFIDLRRDSFIRSWTSEEQEEFIDILKHKKLESCIIDKRFLDHSTTDYYWVIQQSKENVLYSTLSYADPSSPSTLIALMKEDDNITELDANDVFKYGYLGEGSYLHDVIEDQDYRLEGDKRNIEEYLKRVMKKTPESFGKPKHHRYYIQLDEKLGGKNMYMEYSPYHDFDFSEDLDLTFIREKLKKRKETRYPRNIYRFIGDRMCYGPLSLIAMMKHRILDENNMTIIKNFFRSKIFKDEITRIIDIHEDDDPSKPLIHFDELLGMNYETADFVIHQIYSEILISKSIIEKPDIVLRNFLRNINKSYIKGTENRRSIVLDKANKCYKYIDTRDEEHTVKIEGHNYSQIIYYFSKFIIDYEKKLNPNWNNLQNMKYSSMSKYGALATILVQIGVDNWLVEGYRRNELSISFEKDGKLFFYKGRDIESLIKQIS